jgi:hypothetical protein
MHTSSVTVVLVAKTLYVGQRSGHLRYLSSDQVDHSRVTTYPCDGGCGKVIAVEAYWGWPRHYRIARFCPECDERVRREKNRDRVRRYRGGLVQHEPRSCEAPGCHETFIPTRADARYHSNACRQRAHRARHLPDAPKLGPTDAERAVYAEHNQIQRRIRETWRELNGRSEGHAPTLATPRRDARALPAAGLVVDDSIRVRYFDYSEQKSVTRFARVEKIEHDPGCPWNAAFPPTTWLRLDCPDECIRLAKLPPEREVEVEEAVREVFG